MLLCPNGHPADGAPCVEYKCEKLRPVFDRVEREVRNFKPLFGKDLRLSVREFCKMLEDRSHPDREALYVVHRDRFSPPLSVHFGEKVVTLEEGVTSIPVTVAMPCLVEGEE